MLAAIGLTHYLVLAAAIFCLGVLTMVTKRNAIGILIGVELVLNSANLNLVAFNRYQAGGGVDRVLMDGQIFAVFVIVLAAA
ncbi:MAG: NADH-quinone oxidoreductase subunit NuoK, partial [Phycisphaerae bacterium]|nr:NADH-quinone oxidoreductase subunit NuoK [Phycisphaerae bacterium]